MQILSLIPCLTGHFYSILSFKRTLHTENTSTGDNGKWVEMAFMVKNGYAVCRFRHRFERKYKIIYSYRIQYRFLLEFLTIEKLKPLFYSFLVVNKRFLFWYESKSFYSTHKVKHVLPLREKQMGNSVSRFSLDDIKIFSAYFCIFIF